MRNKIMNLFSRKFILSAAVVATGIGMSLQSLDYPRVRIAGIIVSGIAAAVYAYMEGKVDAEAVKNILTGVVDGIADVKTGDDDHE